MDFDPANKIESFGVEESQHGGPVAEDEIFAVPSEAPAFTCVSKTAGLFEGFQIVDESLAAFPFELKELIFFQGEPFSEEVGWEVVLFCDFSCL